MNGDTTKLRFGAIFVVILSYYMMTSKMLGLSYIFIACLWGAWLKNHIEKKSAMNLLRPKKTRIILYKYDKLVEF